MADSNVALSFKPQMLTLCYPTIILQMQKKAICKKSDCCWRMWFLNSGNEYSSHLEWLRTLLTSIKSKESQLIPHSQSVHFSPGEKENAQVMYVLSQCLHGWPCMLVVKYHHYERGCVWQACHTGQMFFHGLWSKFILPEVPEIGGEAAFTPSRVQLMMMRDHSLVSNEMPLG